MDAPDTTNATPPAAAALAARYGTPLYVYDLDRVAAAREELFGSLPEGFDLFYALKANPHPEIGSALREGARPCRAEISSTGELAAALAAGFPAEACLYTGPGKTGEELHAALAAGVRLFSAESAGDLSRIGAVADRHGVVADCLLRINSASASASTSVRMTGTPSQFGLDSETLADLLPELLATSGARVCGAHFFPLSNARDEAALIAEFEHTVALAARLRAETGMPMEYLDIGGGFAAPYGVPGRRSRYPGLRAALEDVLARHFPDWRAEGPRFACESGRYLVGESGTLLTSVVNTKVSRGRRFVVLDAGINTFGGMSGLGRLLPVAVAPSAAEERTDPDGPVTTDPSGESEATAPAGPQRGSLVGPLCTPGDVLGREIDLPPLRTGETVTIPNTGAYGQAASLLAFLGRPAARELTLRQGVPVSLTRIDYRRVTEAHDPAEGPVPARGSEAGPA